MAFRGKPPPYEVRCSPCDVSFAPETRTCLHCGGPTGTPAFFGEPSGEIFAPGEYSAGSPAPQSDSPFQAGHAQSEHAEASVHDAYGMGDASSASGLPHYEGDAEDEEGSQSLGQTLVKSLGSIIWVVLFIGFSLWRSCGSE